MSDIKAGFVWSDKAENFANNKAMALRLNKTIGEATVNLDSVLGWISVKDYGAVGDGTTDDKTAIDAAIGVMTDNSVLYFPAGEYRYSGTATIENLSNIVIAGAGRDVSTLRHLGTSVVVPSDGGDNSNTPATNGGVIMNIETTCDHVVVRDMTFDGNCDTRKYGQQGVHFRANHLKVHDCAFQHGGEFCLSINTDRTDRIQDVMIQNNIVRDCFADGINLRKVDKAVVTGNIVNGCDDDIIALTECTDIVVTGNQLSARVDVLGVAVDNSGSGGYSVNPTVTVTGGIKSGVPTNPPCYVYIDASGNIKEGRFYGPDSTGWGASDTLPTLALSGGTGTISAKLTDWGRGIAILNDNHRILVEGNSVTRVKQSGILVSAEGGTRPSQIQICNNLVADQIAINSGYGVRITEASNVTCNENMIDDIQGGYGYFLGLFDNVSVKGGSIRYTQTGFFRAIGIDETAGGTLWDGLTLEDITIDMPFGGNEAVFFSPGGSQASLRIQNLRILNLTCNTYGGTYIVYNQTSEGVGRISLTNGGSGYTSAPTVAFSGGGGSGAAATCTINGSGAVDSITLTNSGSNYTSAPTISFTGGGGTAAAATATLSKNKIGNNTHGSGASITQGYGSAVGPAATLFNNN
jgi:hypothetical protein